MRKILFFLLLLFCIPFSIFGINGNGTIGSPYNGPLTANMTWSGTVYVNGDITVNGFTLTISPGAIIVFRAAGSDIIITGTGILTASGGPGANMIRFTADFNNNGRYGETGERWGHISFQNMTVGFTGASLINYCIVEFGQKAANPFGFEAAGGGIQTAYSYLTISNSIVRNNSAGYGGGIYVNASASPLITNCLVSHNTAVTTAGGISIYQYSAAVIINCIIEKNTVTGGGGGGGVFVGPFPDNVRFYNCTIASNVSTTNPGNNIRIWKSTTSTGPRFYNTIVWGSGNSSINYYSAGPSVTDFNYCAIQGYTTGYTTCINLNSSNIDPAGPNFYNITAGSEDYQIYFISPCRDAGTSSGAPATDFLGKSRIGPYDIGAYEVQYSHWTGATNTSWSTATNWEGNVDPASGSGDVIIPLIAGLNPNYPVDAGNPGFIVGSGKQMILHPGAQTRLGSLTNNGTLRLESDATGISSLICSSYSGNDAEVQLYLKGGAGTAGPNWHYISSPFISLSTNVFSSVTLDLAQWVENLASINLLIGWVAYDGYVYKVDNNPPYSGPVFSNLDPGKGYNHYFASNYLYTLKGQFNTSDVVANLGYTVTSPDQPTRYGLNLLGNPFSSGLNWDLIANDPTYPVNTSKFIYFNKGGTIVYYINGVGSEPGVTGIVPPMQGFFTKTYSTGHSITLPASARVSGSIPARYKKSETIIPLVRINLTSGTYNDYTVVRFDNSAKSGMDNDFDAPKLFLSGTYPYIYSVSDGNMFAINGQPFPDSTLEIPFVINIPSAGNSSLSATQLQGLDNYKVTLLDKTTGIETNLKTTPVVSFTASTGLLKDRFSLKVSNSPTGIEDPVSSNGIFKIYPSSGYINIQPIADDWDGKSGSVRVLDLSGKVLIDKDNVYFSINSRISLPARLPTGIYIVEIRSGAKRYVGKIAGK